VKRKISVDRSRANSLRSMATTSLERLNSFDKEKYPLNTLDDYYDILHQLMEAISVLKGVKFSNDSANKELIDWVCDTFEFGEQNKVFLQMIRNYRNKISYEGFFIKANFIRQNDEKILGIIFKFENIIEGLI